MAGNVEAKRLSTAYRAISVDDLFDVTDHDVDVDTLSRPASRMSSQSARSRTAPPTTDFDTDDEPDPSKEKANDPRKSKKRAETESSEGSEDIVLTWKRSVPKVCSLYYFLNLYLSPT
jgi:hypothetical protein